MTPEKRQELAAKLDEIAHALREPEAVQPEGKALGYCLLNNEGKMFWHEEGCVASDKESLDAWLESLTDQEPDDGWRIVPFYALQSTRQPEETPRDEVHGE